jgi:dihydroorotate dehydrogenase
MRKGCLCNQFQDFPILHSKMLPSYLRPMLYSLLRELLFCFPPEDVHYFSMNLLKAGNGIGPVKSILKDSFSVTDPSLQKNVFGLQFSNPVGLGAGFDKNALYLHELETLGFGFVEIGTVTPKPQDGNEKPRLFRLPADKALINRMGFNNHGVDVIKQRLEQWNNRKPKTANQKLIVGGNIGKNKITPNADAWKDYCLCFDYLFDEVDYFVVNVSSPNTPGLRELQEKDSLKKYYQNCRTATPQKKNRNLYCSRSRPILPKSNWMILFRFLSKQN